MTRRLLRVPGVSVARHAAATFGLLVAILSVMALVGGTDNLTSSARDEDGYFMFDPAGFSRPTAAIVIEDLDVLKGRFLIHADDAAIPSWAIADLEVRLVGSTRGPGALFMGIAPTDEVDAYLHAVAHDEITDVHLDVAEVREVDYTTHPGTAAPTAPPGAETFWAASVEGSNELVLDWTVRPGEWTTVVMNADASTGVTAELVFGAQATNIAMIGWTKIGIGLVGLLGGGALVFFALRRRDRDTGSFRADLPTAGAPGIDGVDDANRPKRPGPRISV